MGTSEVGGSTTSRWLGGATPSTPSVSGGFPVRSPCTASLPARSQHAHPVDLVKMQSLIQEIWGGTWASALPPAPERCGCCPIWVPWEPGSWSRGRPDFKSYLMFLSSCVALDKSCEAPGGSVYLSVKWVMIISQGVKGWKRHGTWKGVALSISGRLSAGEGWSWVSTQASFLARNPHFSAGLEKQKSAQQKAARQPEGTQLLEGVGTSLLRWQ